MFRRDGALVLNCTVLYRRGFLHRTVNIKGTTGRGLSLHPEIASVGLNSEEGSLLSETVESMSEAGNALH